MSIYPSVQIYPSQLSEFKEKVNELACLLSELLNEKKLSSFKRNDYVSIGLGYKSHNDLVTWANSRKEADERVPLFLFADPKVRDSINQVLCSKVKGLEPRMCSILLSSLEKKECGREILSNIKMNSYLLDRKPFLHASSPTRKLLNSYFAALAGLKMQSGAALLGLAQKGLTINRAELKYAQELMSENTKSVKHIFTIIAKLNITLSQLNEQILKRWLIENDASFSHLNSEPTYYLCYKKIDDKEYYFISRYFDDAEGCAGHSRSLDEVRSMQRRAVNFELAKKGVEKKTLMQSLSFPELCTDVFIKKN